MTRPFKAETRVRGGLPHAHLGPCVRRTLMMAQMETKEIAMGNVKVYKGRRSGELFHAACKTAIRVVRGFDVQGHRECGNASCACHATDASFTLATPGESELFARNAGDPDESLVA